MCAGLRHQMNLPLRQCSGCKHWRRRWPEQKKGYLEAMCDEQPDPRDKKMMRASDSCSKWKKAPPKDPYEDYYF
jgi:hypothetical protein